MNGFSGILALTLFLFAFRSLSISTKDSTYQVKEHIRPPREWVKLSAPPKDHEIRLRIGLPQSKFSELEKHLYEVSDPYHHRYGKHLSKEEVEALVAPYKSSIDVVDAWLESFGIMGTNVVRSPAHDWVTVTIPIGLAEEILDTKYYIWEHVSSGEHLVRTTTYSLPQHVHKHVDVIQPTTIFSRFNAQKSMIIYPNEGAEVVDPDSLLNKKLVSTTSGASVDASCSRTITISCLQQLYNAVGYIPSNNSGNSIGVAAYLEEYANLHDLQLFYADQRPDALNSTFEFISVNGGLNDQNLEQAGAEAGLDVQFAFGLSYPVASTFYSTAGRGGYIPDRITPNNTNEPFMDWIDSVLSQSNPPLAISTSFGDSEQTVPKSYAERVCSGFAQLGARGVSLLFASGDWGVGDGNPGSANQTCLTNDGQNATKFLPIFPASCPYVTAVGGTTGISPEVAVSRYYSGGGFSNYFDQPTYQKDAVSRYLNALPSGTYQGLYNPQGRAFPDVATQGDNFRIFNKGVAIHIGGTSASSPAFAGLVALLNDVRLRNNFPPLGFLNPFIYSTGSKGFTDVTIGNAAGCGTPGFKASEGWDPVTGYGTPNFALLKDLVLNKTITAPGNATSSNAAQVMTTARTLQFAIGTLLQCSLMKVLYDLVAV